MSALGLLVTLVWLYLEMLRLLSKLPQLISATIVSHRSARARNRRDHRCRRPCSAAPSARSSASRSIAGGARRRERCDLRMAPHLRLVMLDRSRGVHARLDLVVADDVGRTVRRTPSASSSATAGYVPELSTRQNRHVYRRGFMPRRGFATTLGNVIGGAGDIERPRRRRLVTDHEDVHCWQARWLGPLYPMPSTSVGPWLAGAAGIVIWAVRRRDERFTQGGRVDGVLPEPARVVGVQP